MRFERLVLRARAPRATLPLLALLAVTSVHGLATCRSVRGSAQSVSTASPGSREFRESRGAEASAHECATIDGTLAALYDVISGEAGEERDWERFGGLFHPEWGRLGAAVRSAPSSAPDGSATPRFESLPMTPAEYRSLAGSFFESAPFYEREAHRELQQFGAVAHAFSAYESRKAPDAEPFARGVNSIQLFFDGERWWIVSILWFEEDSEFPLPAALLGGAGARGTAPK